ITGFANSVVSPALEFKHEGYILGTAAQMFSIAGPVIVYGVGSSFIYGLIIYIFKLY
ncbi:MAG: SpoVA/SpoVAEb family sporulation membrane protein, partial [Eubacterium sp.]